MAMSQEDVAALFRRHGELKSDRQQWEGHWRQITRRVLPRQDDFQGSRSQGARRSEYIFDSTAPLALERFASAMEGMLFPRAETWHRITSSDKDLNKIAAVRRYFEEVNNILFVERYRPTANFASQAHESMVSLGSIGTGALLVDELQAPGARGGKAFGTVYKSIHMSEITIAEDLHGKVDTVFREFDWTARQAAQKWGAEKLPQNIKSVLNQTPDRKFTFLHAIYPRADRDPGRLDWRGMQYASCYASLEGKQLMSEGGYRTMPIAVSRYVTAPRETYGRSPAMQALPDIKMANEMVKTLLRAVHMGVSPPTLISDDGVLGRLQMKPGGLVVGGMNSRGQAQVQSLGSDAKVEWGLNMLESSRKTINDAFLITLFEILVDTPDRMTATEVLERMREKGVLLAPTMGRQESEMLGPMIEREIDILGTAGRLPDMPGELIEAEGEYRTVYENPLSRAQRAQQQVGVLRWMEAVAPIAQADPTIYDIVNRERVGRGLWEGFGVPELWLNTEDELGALKDKRTSDEDAQTLAAGAPIAAKTAVDLAKAQQLEGAAVA